MSDAAHAVPSVDPEIFGECVDAVEQDWQMGYGENPDIWAFCIDVCATYILKVRSK
jgi:restriction endonuclease Mrr